MFQTFQVNNGFIHYDSMTYKAYKYVFLKHPRNLDMGAYWDRLKQPDYKACLKGDRDFDWSETK